MRTPEQDAQRNEIVLMALQTPDGRIALSSAMLHSIHECLESYGKHYYDSFAVYMEKQNVIEYVCNRLLGLTLLNIRTNNSIDLLQIVLMNEYLLYYRFYAEIQSVFGELHTNNHLKPVFNLNDSL